MVSIDTLFPRILPFVQGCSEPMVRQAALDAAIRFCDKTNVMREALDTFTTVSGITAYDVDTPSAQLRVARILSVTVDGEKLKGVFEEDVDNLANLTGKPMMFYTTRIGSEFQLNFYPKPDAKYTVKVTASFAPTYNATTIEDDLVDYWYEGIVAGAISQLAKIPNMPFFNPDLAMLKEQEFMRVCSKAKTESYYGHVRGGITMKQRPLA